MGSKYILRTRLPDSYCSADMGRAAGVHARSQLHTPLADLRGSGSA